MMANAEQQAAFCVQLERFAEDEARAVGYELDKDLKSFGRGFTVLEQVRLPHAALLISIICHFQIFSTKKAGSIHMGW